MNKKELLKASKGEIIREYNKVLIPVLDYSDYSSCLHCSDCTYCSYCSHCSDLSHCLHCAYCSDCLYCKVLYRKAYCILNIQLTKEEYFNIKNKLNI